MVNYRSAPFRKILTPYLAGCDQSAALRIARAIAGDSKISLVGLVPCPPEESLSAASGLAAQVRKALIEQGSLAPTQNCGVHVSYEPWQELLETVEKEHPDLLILQWPDHFSALGIEISAALAHPPCNIAITSGPIPANLEHALLAMRGGTYAELGLRLALALHRNHQTHITALHLTDPGAPSAHDAPFLGLAQVLPALPEITRLEIQTGNPPEAILSAAQSADLVIMGATARPGLAGASLGPVAERVLTESRNGALIIKTRQPMPPEPHTAPIGHTAISVLVDKWFAENTYHAEEFADLDYLLQLKQRQNLTISLALPALNEAETISNVIQTVKCALMDEVPLLDEIVLIDSDSSDATRQIAADLGIPVYIHQHLLPEYGSRRGKGEALWKSLQVTHGDLLLWIDTDIVNIHPRFVYGLVGALLSNPQAQFVKGFYRRPLKVGDKIQAGGGGRVTELTARPLLNLFYPELSGVVQPLSGEYGGRRRALERMPFFSGYGVEIGLLIEALELFGLGGIAQVDLQERIHHNQSLESLSKMSFAIIQAVIHKLERRYGREILADVNKSMKLIRYEPGRLWLDVQEISEQERPPMISLPEYQPGRRPQGVPA